MGIFGWSLPPGVTRLPGEDDEGPCAVCAKPVDSCVCQECPICQGTGEPRCYVLGTPDHPPSARLKLSREQAVGRTEARVAVIRQRLLDEDDALRNLIEGGPFSQELSDNPDPWR